jgi:hypothetical protein
MEKRAAPRRPRIAAEDGEDDRLHQELAQDVAPPRAQGLAHADLADALGHRDEHDVHDHDAAHRSG